MLPFGNGRSYGDVCLNREGCLVDSRALDALTLEADTGIVRAGGGVLLGDVLDLVVPKGWFLPVSPGTKFVTVGGAIANDVHGKNHHRAGCFGGHVLRFEVLRSDGSRTVCSPEQNVDLFEATIGGLGLTGLITWAEVRMKRIEGPEIVAESTRFGTLGHFFALSKETEDTHEYTVAWIDCLARGDDAGRGWFFAGNHRAGQGDDGKGTTRRPTLRVPFTSPFPLVNRISLRLFNTLYYARSRPAREVVHYDGFFYPLDSIREWNRIYGPNGFYQFQCVIPDRFGEEGIREILAQIAEAGRGSFLAVLKQFGDRPSPGWLSFPRPGPTLALDFPNRGAETRRLLKRLEAVVAEAGGAIYPAKDACMSPSTFQAAYPRWEELEALRDPAFSSDFWRRTTG